MEFREGKEGKGRRGGEVREWGEKGMGGGGKERRREQRNVLDEFILGGEWTLLPTLI